MEHFESKNWQDIGKTAFFESLFWEGKLLADWL
jgi:hypothetical protein